MDAATDLVGIDEEGVRMGHAVVHAGVVYLAGQVGTPGTGAAAKTTGVPA